jgi:hypothetical protein
MTTPKTSATAAPALDPGKARSLQRVTSADGFFLICALDHLSDFQQLLAPDPATVDYARTVAAKLELIRVLAPEVSAFLLDARLGLPRRSSPGRCRAASGSWRASRMRTISMHQAPGERACASTGGRSRSS